MSKRVPTSRAKLFKDMLTGSMARGLFGKRGETRFCIECGCWANCSASGKGFFGNWGCWIPKGCLMIKADEEIVTGGIGYQDKQAMQRV